MRCSSLAIHCCINIKHLTRDGENTWEGICAILLEEEVWVQCSAIWDLLMLISDPDLNTHKFTDRVHSKSLWRAEQHTIHTAVSGDTHLSISRWIIEGTPPPPCFLHGLELVAFAEYKDHVALEFEGRICSNLYVLLMLYVLPSPFFYLSIPLLYLSSFPLVLFSHPADSYQNDFPPHTLPRPYFDALAFSYTFNFLASYSNLISQG